MRVVPPNRRPENPRKEGLAMSEFKWKQFNVGIEISGTSREARYEAFKLHQRICDANERAEKRLMGALVGKAVYHHGDKA